MATSPTTSKTSTAQWLTLGAAFLGWMLDGVEQGIFPIIARPALQEMLAVQGDREVGLWMGRLTAFFLIGAAGGGAAFGWLGDKIGRVKAMGWSILAYSVFTGACYFAREPWHLAVFRVLAALGMGGQWSLGVALVMETWPERHRPMLAGAIGAAANAGFLLIGLVAYFFPVTGGSWRWIMLVGSAPAVLTFLIRLYVPESERWRESTVGVANRPFTELVARGARRNLIMAITVSSVALIGTWGSVQWLPLWADRLTGGTNPAAKAVTAMVLAAGAMLGGFIGSYVAKYGRRQAFCIFCVISYGLCWVLFNKVTVYGWPFILLTLCVGAMTCTFYGWLPLYLPELFPTRIRATATGVSYNSGRILAAAGALGAGQLVSYYGGSYARMGTAITVIYLVGAVVIWAAPETKGRPLPA
jgi:SHS family sialic acid transporter-like MFS transporter